MRIDILMKLAALTLGSAMTLASAQQPGASAPAAAATRGNPATAPGFAAQPAAAPTVPAQPAVGTAPAAAVGPSGSTGATDSFGADWTGRPQAPADAQREARAAASEALKDCRRQPGGAERCLEATRRDNAASIQRASRSRSKAPATGARTRATRPR